MTLERYFRFLTFMYQVCEEYYSITYGYYGLINLVFTERLTFNQGSGLALIVPTAHFATPGIGVVVGEGGRLGLQELWSPNARGPRPHMSSVGSATGQTTAKLNQRHEEMVADATT